MAYLLIAFPQMTPTDDGKKRITSKSHGSHVLETILVQHKKRRPNKKHWCDAGQIPSECQVRTSHNSKVPELGWIMCTFFLRAIGFL